MTRTVVSSIYPKTVFKARLQNFGRVKSTKWFSVPADLKARVLWRVPLEKAKSARFAWIDLTHGTPSRADLRSASFLEVPDEAGVFPISFSPDGSRLSFDVSLPTLDFNGAHNTGIADLGSGHFFLWRRGLWSEANETWSPDGREIAFIAGTDEKLGSGRVDNSPSLCVRAAVPDGQERTLIESGASFPNWTPANGIWANKGNIVFRFDGATKVGKAVFTDAENVRASPDEHHIAFWNRWDGLEGGFYPTRSLKIADAVGKNQRFLATIDTRQSMILWNPRDQSPLLWSLDAPEKGSDKPFQFPVTLHLSLWDAKDNRHEIAALQTQYDSPDASVDFPEITLYQALGVSKNGNYFLFHRAEHGYNEEENTAPILSDALYAIRLRDGKLIPIAVFGTDLHISLK